MVIFPPCKINLGLSVLSKRSDGYHNLETCFYPVPWRDVLEIILADAFEFTSSGNIIPGKPEENLCVRAYQMLKKDFDLSPVKIHLHKIIPSGAGLGGGSSDAAYTLRLLNEIFLLNLSQPVLMDYAARMGSDCPFFIQDKAMLGTGRGEILNDVSLSTKGKFLVVVKPDIHVSTTEAFAGIIPHQPLHPVREIVTRYPIAKWKDLLKNDFENSVFEKYPEIKSIKEKMYSIGAIYASMSGSGSAVYGLFENDPEVDLTFQNYNCWKGLTE